MDSSLERLCLQGYSPRSMLDIGANIGSYSREFVQLFPNCKPTMLEPNPYCFEVLRKLPFELIAVAAADVNGTSKLYLTKEWLQSTGASLHREKTQYFRDEVVFTAEVRTVRLDDLFEARRFDFIKIDVQGAEMAVLLGGARVIRDADYVHIEIPIAKYNEGASLAEDILKKMDEYGFRASAITHVHRLRSVMDGAVIQIDVLFERTVLRGMQSYRLARANDLRRVIKIVESEKEKNKEFSILIVGEAGRNLADESVDTIFGLDRGAWRGSYICGNPEDPRDWGQILSHVEKNGRFAFCICANLIQNHADPVTSLKLLPLFAEAGFVSIPSQFSELQRSEQGHRGAVYRRWIFAVKNQELNVIPKLPIVEKIVFDGEELWKELPEIGEMQITWRKKIKFSLPTIKWNGLVTAEFVQKYEDLLGTNQKSTIRR